MSGNRVLVNGLDGTQLFVVTDNPQPIFTLMAKEEGTPATHCVVRLVEVMGNVVRWDSDRLGIESHHVRYTGPKLQSKTAYRVEMTLFEQTQTLEALQTTFETGFMGKPWQSAWIEPVQEPAIPEKRIKFHEMFSPCVDDGKITERLRSCQFIGKTFWCDKPPVRARLYATAHGVYQLTLNGIQVGERLLSPETSSYQERLYYQTYDITEQLCEGENAVEALLADGWWIGRIGISGDSCQYGDRLGLLLQLELTYPDGETQLICSDTSFTCRPSHIDYADLFVGERHDYTAQPKQYQQCHLATYDTVNLVAQPTAPIVKCSELRPRYFTTPKGELVADFGQVVAGVVEIGVDLPKAAKLTLDFCEVLDEQGNYFRNIIGRHKNQQDVAVCPTGVTEFQPKFTYHGFRYVRISGVQQAQITQLKAVAIGTMLESRGRFSCSDQDLNQLHHNIRWSTRGNMVSVPTDCPQREKMGWTGDIQLFTKTAGFNYDMSNFLEGWLENMQAEQTEEGEIPCVVPCYPIQDQMEREKSGANSSPAWGDACILVPLYLYEIYGNINVLKDNLAMMEGWLAYIKATASQRPENWDSMSQGQKERNQYLWTKGHQFGDWLIPSLRENGHAGVEAGVQATYRVVGSSFYAITVRAYIQVLEALVESGIDVSACREKIGEYQKLLGQIKQAVQEEYIAPDGFIQGDLQGMYVLALYAEIGDKQLRKMMAKHLARLIEENQWRLDTGFVSVPYLLDVLTETGYQLVAYKLLFQPRCPSWLYMVHNGATTMWENWAAIRPDGEVTNSSYNHYALGCVGDWIYRRIAGIAPAEVGYRRVRFAPLFDIELKWAQGSHDTLYGRVNSSWRKNSGEVYYEVVLPVGVSGEVLLPIDSTDALEKYSGPKELRDLKAKSSGENLILEIGAGTHSFTFKSQR